MSKRFFHDRILSFREGQMYVAVSLEFDLVAEASTMEKALQRLFKATVGYLKICVEDDLKDENIYRPAPKKYQNMFENSQKISKILTRQQKGTLKEKDQKLIKKEIQAIFRAYDSRTISANVNTPTPLNGNR